MKTGWIKLYRSLWDQEQSADPYWVVLWIYILTHASRKETEVTFKGKRMTLKPGQLLLTVRALENAVPSLKRDRVCRLLSTMIEDRLIDKKSDRRFTLITVVEWESYQGAVGQLSDIEQEGEKNKKVKPNKLVADNPPTVEEVEEFVRAKNLSVDSQRFWDYYDTTDWTIEANGKNPRPMKNWKSVARNWSDRNGNGKPAPSASEDRIDYGGIMQQVKNASR